MAESYSQKQHIHNLLYKTMPDTNLWALIRRMKTLKRARSCQTRFWILLKAIYKEKHTSWETHITPETRGLQWDLPEAARNTRFIAKTAVSETRGAKFVAETTTSALTDIRINIKTKVCICAQEHQNLHKITEVASIY